MTSETNAPESPHFSYFFTEAMQFCRIFDSKRLSQPMQWLSLSPVPSLSPGSGVNTRIMPLLLARPDRLCGMTRKRSFP
jgi:hypothetical protein